MNTLKWSIDLQPTHESCELGFMTETGCFLRHAVGSFAVINGLFRASFSDPVCLVMLEVWLNQQEHPWEIVLRDLSSRSAVRGKGKSLYGPWYEAYAY